VFHKVQYGQSLWSIAIEYGTTIKSIQALNGLGDDSVVYQGQELLVKKEATQPVTLTATAATLSASRTPTVAPTATILLPTPTFAPTVTSAPVQPSTSPNSKLLVGILIFAAFIGAGVAVWLIRDPKSN
jgi:LysM repeat protein